MGEASSVDAGEGRRGGFVAVLIELMPEAWRFKGLRTGGVGVADVVSDFKPLDTEIFDIGEEGGFESLAGGVRVKLDALLFRGGAEAFL